ncbi:MAG: hypothetical protein CL840_02585 [Crocinitomicaceae bacterium]|nr:hypothetical protein [Crocinitomicaceae bacterium]|tara:strand:+ start:1203 stop:2123 length:921 start_codon:yes stop_codon:yes gene_type:complete
MLNYSLFALTPQVIPKILIALGIIQNKGILIKIDNTPDYDISEYQREVDTDYYFHNHWGFKDHFQSIVDAHFREQFIFHFDDLTRASKELGLPFDHSNHTEFVNQIYSSYPKKLPEYSFSIEWDEFKFKNLRLVSIDNIKKKLFYEGAFFGNSDTITPLDWGVYSLLNLTCVSFSRLPFYKQLVLEGYLLKKEGKYKLAFFLTYSAFESFVNFKSGTADDEERLKEKVTKLYRNQFPKLEKHQIYCSVMNQYDKFTNDRNNIAHGTRQIEVSQEELDSLLIFVLIMISCYEFNFKKFDELSAKVSL